MSNKRPNVILIGTDQQRYDCLGASGNQVIQTPNLDLLAAGSCHFRCACVQGIVCVPSRASIQTGRYLHQHGVTYMENEVDFTPGLPESEKTFMELLQAAGYETAAVGKIHMYPPKGFDWLNLTGGKGQRWLDPYKSELGPGPLGESYASWLEERRPGAYYEIYAERRRQSDYSKIGLYDIPLTADEYVDHWIGSEAVKYISRRAHDVKPFFLWCGFCGPHGPLDPPPPYRTMYDPSEVPLPDPHVEGSWREKWSESLMRRAVAYYYGMISLIDAQVGRIVDELKQTSLYDDTLIVFLSDHGEMLGERGRMGKGVFHEPVLRVPLVIKPPAGAHCVTAVSEPCEVFGVASTILDYSSVDQPKSMTARSLRGVLEGTERSDGRAFSEYVDNDRHESAKCIRTASHKFVKWSASGREEFYDLRSDPLEDHNLSETGDQSEVLRDLRGEMLDWLAQTEWRHNYRF